MATINLHIIDLTLQSELNIGKRLADEISLWSIDGKWSMASCYTRIGNKTDLRQLIQKIVERCKSHQEIPILHFEAHSYPEGTNSDGIKIGEFEDCRWGDFLELLRVVNVATKNQLVVTMATCKAAWLVLSIEIDKPCPFCLLIAPIENVKVGEVEYGFQDFYRSLIVDFNVQGCLQALNERLKPSENRFVAIDAEELFCDVASTYVEKLSSGGARRGRLESLVSQAVAGGITKEISLSNVRKKFRIVLWGDPHIELIPLFEKFLMIDQFPENQKRFNYSLPR